jgi:crossover junction endodeoxyribonuclease RuvC
MRVLGIDPGIARTGWAVLEEKNGKIIPLAFNCLETSSKEEHSKRLEKIYLEIKRLIKKYNPETLVIEELFFSSNAKTALIVGQARGVVFLAAAQEKIKSISYTPLQIKLAVSGYGRAEKSQIGRMVKTILNLKEIPKLDDTSDAIAAALTHVFSNKQRAIRDTR